MDVMVAAEGRSSAYIDCISSLCALRSLSQNAFYCLKDCGSKHDMWIVLDG
jgi:ribosomal silencing factor RsfS